MIHTDSQDESAEFREELNIKTSRARHLYRGLHQSKVTIKINYLQSLLSVAYSCTIIPYLTMLLRATYFKLNLTFMVVSVVSMRMRVDWTGVNTSMET